MSASKPTAFSYVRFSTVEQRKGGSLERQTESARQWCKRNNVALDTSRSWHDLGSSAYLGDHRKNPDRHALAAFLKMVEDGHIAPGSYLIIESLDRLTREHVRAGVKLCFDLIDKGIKLVQLSPSEIVYDEKSGDMSLMMMMMELSRGHGESKRKSDLVAPAWREKKRRARSGEAQKETARMGQGRSTMTLRLPGWIEVKDDKRCLIPERAAVIRRIFDLAISGYGLFRIAGVLNDDEVPCWCTPSGKTARPVGWSKTYIGRIISDRRAVGEYQPRKLVRKDGKLRREPDGDPVPGYFPAAVDEATFLRASAAAKARTRQKGREGAEGVNVFKGMIKDARGGSYIRVGRRADHGEGRHYHVLINGEGLSRGGSTCAFPYEPFETEILKALAEVDPREVLGENKDADEAQSLAGERDRITERLAALSAALEDGEVSSVVKKMRELEARQRDVVARLADAQQRAASPLSAALGDAKSLIGILRDARDPDDARTRLRAALARVVEDIILLVVPAGKTTARVAVAQVYFKQGGGCRSYLIWHRRAAGGKAGYRREPETHSRVIGPDDPLTSIVDLRQPDDVAALIRRLEALDVSAFTS